MTLDLLSEKGFSIIKAELALDHRVMEPMEKTTKYELRFFSREEMPEPYAEDHRAALEVYFAGVRYPILKENKKTGETSE